MVLRAWRNDKVEQIREVLGGDRLEMDVALAPGSVATILTQAANKVYRGAETHQNAIFHVGGGFLEYLPHHLSRSHAPAFGKRRRST